MFVSLQWACVLTSIFTCRVGIIFLLIGLAFLITGIVMWRRQKAAARQAIEEQRTRVGLLLLIIKKIELTPDISWSFPFILLTFHRSSIKVRYGIYFLRLKPHPRRNGNVANLVKYSSLATLEVIILTTSNAASDTKFHQNDDIFVSVLTQLCRGHALCNTVSCRTVLYEEFIVQVLTLHTVAFCIFEITSLWTHRFTVWERPLHLITHSITHFSGSVLKKD